MARAEQAGGRRARHRICIPSSTRTCAKRWSSETQLFVAQSDSSRIAGHRAAVGRLHVCRTSGWRQHYGIPNVYGNHFRPVKFADGTRGGLLGQGSLLTVTSYPQPHIRRDARALAAGEHARRAATAAAARCAGAQRAWRRRAAQVAARADGGSSEEPGVRVVSSADGSARVLAREFRRGRQVAHRGRRRAGRSRPRRCPMAPSSPASTGLRTYLVNNKEDFVQDAQRQAAGVCDWPRHRVLRPARHPENRARRGAERLPLVVGHSAASSTACRSAWRRRWRSARGRCGAEQTRDWHEERAMIISKKAIPRRTMLRGMGAMLALPLLDSMVPALSALRRPPASRSTASACSTCRTA